MYFNFLVKIPSVQGKIVRKKKAGIIYIDYEYDRIYIPEKRYTNVKRATIGKQSNDDCTMMWPNENYLKYFPGEEVPEIREGELRSSCLKVGSNIVINKIFDDYKLGDILSTYFNNEEIGLIQDLMAYTIICENNAAQYYPDYAYNHALRSDKMHIYSDSKISDFLMSVKDDQRIGVLNDWNAGRNHSEKIYISYDSTNKHCQAGDLEIVEVGKFKEGQLAPVFNYSVGYDTENKEPLFYEEYPGSINDVAQLQYMVEKAKGYGYKNIGFILDRGYFSRANISAMDKQGYDFVMMVKGMSSLVYDLIKSVHGTFENKRDNSIRTYKVYGTTVKKKLFESDEKERYFHIYYSDTKGCSEREAFESKIEKLSKYLKRKEFQYNTSFAEAIKQYFYLEYDNEGVFLGAYEKKDVIEDELSMCGYFVIVTSNEMSAKEALLLYKSRDASEKLFRGDKSYLGNKSTRVYSDESVSTKIFIGFLALIIRSKFYVCLQQELEQMDTRPNYMTVPAAIRELEKIEMIRLLDGEYRLDHAVTATQKTILNAFGIDTKYIRQHAANFSSILKN